MSDTGPVRNSQRTVLACTACARRKIRCSKTIPCTTCTRQGKAASCVREPVVATRQAAARRRSLQGRSSRTHLTPGTPKDGTPDPVISAADSSVESDLPPTAPDVQHRPTHQPLPEITEEALLQLLAAKPASGSRLTNEAAAALEFLAHGRRNVLDRIVGRESASRPVALSQWVNDGLGERWDTFLPVEDARTLPALHQAT